MQAIPAQATAATATAPRPAVRPAPAVSAYQGYQILRRNGAVVSFEPNKIAVALMKAFLAVHGTQGAASASVRETVDGLTESVVRALLRSLPAAALHIEDVQTGRALVCSAAPSRRPTCSSRASIRRSGEAGPATPALPVLMSPTAQPRAADAARLRRCRTLVRRPRADVGRPDPGRDQAQPLRPRADRRGAPAAILAPAPDRKSPCYTAPRALPCTDPREISSMSCSMRLPPATPSTSRSS